MIPLRVLFFARFSRYCVASGFRHFGVEAGFRHVCAVVGQSRSATERGLGRRIGIAFVTNALSPAKVQRVSIVDDGDRVMEVIVEDKQLSLAIGKKGQNVRLAAKLTGWRIDIKSEEEKRREVEAQFEGLESIGDSTGEAAAAADQTGEALAPQTDGPGSDEDGPPAGAAADAGEESDEAAAAPLPFELDGISPKMVRKLVEAGYESQNAVAGASAEQLAEIPGIGDKTAEPILTAARGDAAAGTDV